MKTVAEHLKPPFVAAIMLDVIQAGGDDGPSPSDELVSIAPAQEGFLGLETTCDNQGRWVSISYWRKFRVSNVEEPVMPSRQFMAPERAIPNSARERRSGFGSKVFNAFPAIAELLGYEHAR